MAGISFIAKAAGISNSVSRYAPDAAPSRWLTYRIEPEGRNSVELSTGGNLKDLDGALSVRLRGDGEPVRSKEGDSVAYGLLSYFKGSDDVISPFPPRYMIELGLTQAEFDQLLWAARFGRVPVLISVEAEGMEYDWQPDGSGKKWDNAKQKVLAVTEYSFSIPLAGADENVDDDEASLRLPPNQRQLSDILRQLEAMGAQIKTGNSIVMWAAVIIVAILIFLRR